MTRETFYDLLFQQIVVKNFGDEQLEKRFPNFQNILRTLASIGSIRMKKTNDGSIEDHLRKRHYFAIRTSIFDTNFVEISLDKHSYVSSYEVKNFLFDLYELIEKGAPGLSSSDKSDLSVLLAEHASSLGSLVRNPKLFLY